MGDKSPKSKDKAKKQDNVKRAHDKEAHDKKQAKPEPAVKPKGKK